MIGASFDSTKTPLQDLFAGAEEPIQRIEPANGKSITRVSKLYRAGVVAEAYDEGPEDWDAEELLEEVES